MVGGKSIHVLADPRIGMKGWFIAYSTCAHVNIYTQIHAELVMLKI
jgi:hypothetical protein